MSKNDKKLIDEMRNQASNAYMIGMRSYASILWKAANRLEQIVREKGD